jgi:hypothetical protein
LADPEDRATIVEGDTRRREEQAMPVSPVLADAVEPPVLQEPRSTTADSGEPLLAPGTKVEVRKRLDGEWARGFEVVSAGRDGYRVRRLSDGGELPLTISDDDVRKERKRGTWWY